MKPLYPIFAAAMLTVAAIQPSFAAADLASRIAECRREQDDTLRLACFDRAAVPQESFGAQGSELARSRVADNPKQGSTAKRIAATVTGIDERAHGELVFTLDNGQVWAQKEVGAHLPIKVGDSISILAGSLGSHQLVIANRSTPVTRVR